MWRIWAAAGFIIVAMTAGSCFGPESQICHNGASCQAGYQCTYYGDACVPAGSTCGNGYMDEGEICDDGNARAGDGCSPSCQFEGICGDGIRDPGEACDDGNKNSGDGCSGDCLWVEGCGNGHLDLGEGCDDGNSFPCGTCSADCAQTQSGANCTFGTGCVSNQDCAFGLNCLPGGSDGGSGKVCR